METIVAISIIFGVLGIAYGLQADKLRSYASLKRRAEMNAMLRYHAERGQRHD